MDDDVQRPAEQTVDSPHLLRFRSSAPATIQSRSSSDEVAVAQWHSNVVRRKRTWTAPAELPETGFSGGPDEVPVVAPARVEEAGRQ